MAAAKANRSKVEYYFTLSPCWPRWLLRTQPGVRGLVTALIGLASHRPVTWVASAMSAEDVVAAERHDGRPFLVTRRQPAFAGRFDLVPSMMRDGGRVSQRHSVGHSVLSFDTRSRSLSRQR